MSRLYFLLLSLFLVAGCEPSVEGYVKNAKDREAKLRECAEMGVLAAKDNEQCQMAMEAQGIVLRQAAGSLMDAITLQSAPEKAEKEPLISE